MAEDRSERAGKNEALFREVNERVAELNQTFLQVIDYGSWVCECARRSCVERCDMSMAEYDEVRSDSTQFLIAPDRSHFVPKDEELVLQTDRYWVVRKLGEAAEAAREVS